MSMKTLNDGTEISQEAFGSIFGGGLKKALDTPRKLKVDGQKFEFTIRELDKVQELIDALVSENAKLTAQNERMRLAVKKMAKVPEDVGHVPGTGWYVTDYDKPIKGKKRGRPRKNPLPGSNVVPITKKPRVRVQAGSSRAAA